MKEYIVSLWSVGGTSLNRLRKLAGRRLGLEVSEGTVSSILVDFASKCGKAVETIKEFLKRSRTRGRMRRE